MRLAVLLSIVTLLPAPAWGQSRAGPRLRARVRATTVRGPRGTVPALPLDRVIPLLKEYRAIP